MILMGFIIVKAGIVKDEDSKVLSKIVLYLIIPCVIINAFQVDYTSKTVRGLLIAFAASVILQLVLLFIISAMGRLFHMNEVEVASVYYSNSGNLIVPIVTFILGQEWVMVLAPFPTIFFLMWNRNLQLTRNLKEAMEMNGHLSRRISPEVGIASLEDKVFSSEEALVFAGGTKEMLEVKAGDFLYAEAKGNYVKVGYRSDSDKEKKITWRLLRATMKQAEEAVSACPFIIRCHRAFLVNIRMVVKVDGNSQGYKLNLEGCEEDVPVSRAYAKEVKALIENRTKS